MAVYDCFIFNDELDLLDIRFQELGNVVDRFVIVEATKTFSGKPKPLYLRDNLNRFLPILGKLTHVMVDDFPNTNNPWDIERHQRNCILRGLEQCKGTDIIAISDCDEIISREVFTPYTPFNDIQALEMDMYYYDMHTKGDDKWYFAKIAPCITVRQMQPHGIRNAAKYGIITNAGRHLSFFGGVDAIIKKIESFSHQEYNTPEFKNRVRIQTAIDQGVDLFGRGIQFKKV